MSSEFVEPGRLARAARVFTTALALLVVPSSASFAGWGSSGIPATRAPLAQSRPVAVSDQAGGMLVAWLDWRSGYNIDVVAQRIVPVGSLATGWPVDGAKLTNVTCSKYDLALTSDGAGGAIATWADVRCPASGPTRIYAERVRPDGTCDPRWPANGRALCSAPGEQKKPAITGDGAGGAFVVWNDLRSGAAALYATRLLDSGTPAPGWPATGVMLAAATRDSSAALVAATADGGCIAAWIVPGARGDTVRVQRLTRDGAVASGWPAAGVTVCALDGVRTALTIAPDGASGAYLAWVDRRGVDADLYVTRVAGDGSRPAGWNGSGNLAGGTAGDALEPRLVAGAAGDAYLVWTDRRAGNDGSDIRALRWDPSGAVHAGWPAGGMPVCAAARDQDSPTPAADGAGGLLVAWTDARSASAAGLEIFVQRVTGSGAPAAGWVPDGHPLCRRSYGQSTPVLVGDGSGGALGAWVDARNQATSGPDIFANRISGDGPLPTQVRKLAALHHDGQTFLTCTGPASTGITYRFYSSSNPITSAADLAAATLVGSPQDSSWCALRLSQFLGRTYAYSVDSLAAPLDSSQVLFVTTATAERAVYYAATAQANDEGEDVTVTPGQNALLAPVAEHVNRPRPVYQRRVIVHDQPTDMYTLWTSAVETPLFPAMSNRTSQPFDAAVLRGYSPTDHSMLVRPATRNLYCLNVIWWTPGYWLLAFDDLLPAVQGSFYYGYHEGFDLFARHQAPPLTGYVPDYTRQRGIFTLEWARRNFPIDTSRVYLFGYSCAAAGSATLTFAAPGLIAGTGSVSGKYDFSFQSEPDPGALFNPGQIYELATSELWGSLQSNLPTSGGLHVYDRVNLGFMAGWMEPTAVPPIMSFDGRKDVVMGWAEKVNFYRAMQRHRQGGLFFWDNHTHNTDLSQMWWIPMCGPDYLWRFRTDRSFPALSNCSADGDPGDGRLESGDSLGTINGHVEWDTTMVDETLRWGVTLRPRDLTTTLGPFPAPDSFTVDVTPRRLRRFRTPPGTPCTFTVVRLADSTVVQSGEVVADSLGRVTIEGVRVLRRGTALEIKAAAWLAAEPDPPAPPRALALAVGRNPVIGVAEVLVSWPRAGQGRVDLFDVGGRRVRCLAAGAVTAGPSRLALPSEGLAGGIYWLTAAIRDERVTRRVVVLR